MKQMDPALESGTIHETRILLFAIVFVLVGLLLIVISFYMNLKNPSGLLQYLFLNVGGLFTIGGAYNMLNDLFLKKKFAQQIQESINRKLEKVAIDESIGAFGLYKIEKVFSNDTLFKKISNSSKVTMVVTRSSGFFHFYYPELLELLKKDNFNLTVIMPKPNEETLSQIKSRFVGNSLGELIEQSKKVINQILRKEIFEKLEITKRSNISLRFFNSSPVYSAYIFDDNEFWITPFYYRTNRRHVPIFMFKGEHTIRNNEIFLDILSVRNELSTEHNLNEEI